jgi:hypothetical protein
MLTQNQKKEMDDAVAGIKTLPGFILHIVEMFLFLFLVFLWIFRHKEPEPELLEKIIEIKQIRLTKKIERLHRIFKS